MYQAQLKLSSDEYVYLQSRSEAGIGRRIDAFYHYRSFLGPGRILDWGCKHGVDSTLIKHTMGENVELFGCDVGENNFQAFHQYAQLKFTQLNHSYRLPYADKEFDYIIASGVLEHVPNDSESLKELYRILKTGGILIITFLPNRRSYTEAFVRWIGGPAHLRRYSLKETKKTLLHQGFIPIKEGYHQLLPSLSSLGSNFLGKFEIIQKIISSLYILNGRFERIWPIRLFSSNLIVIAKKTDCI